MPHQEIVDMFRSVALVAHTSQQPRVGLLETATFHVLNLGPAHAVVTAWGWRLTDEISSAPGQVRTHTVPMWEVVAPGQESAQLPFQDAEGWLRHLTRHVRGDTATLQNLTRPRKLLVRVQTTEGDGDLVYDVDVHYTSDNPWTAETRLLRK